MTVLILRRGKYLHERPARIPSGSVTGLGKHRLHSEERLQLKGQGVLLTFAEPNLTTAEQGKTDKPAHIEFLTVVDELHSGTIDLAVFRVQNFSSLIFIALFRQTPQDGHAHHRLIAPAPFAFFAIRILRLARIGKNLLNFAFVLSVHFSYAYQTTGLACVVVNSFPEAERRRVDRKSSGTDDDENHQKRGVKRFHQNSKSSLNLFRAAIAESFRGLYKFPTDADHLMKDYLQWQLAPSLLSPSTGEMQEGIFRFFGCGPGALSQTYSRSA